MKHKFVLIQCIALGLSACQMAREDAPADPAEHHGDDEAVFVEIAQDPESGIDYHRVKSTTDDLMQHIKDATLADPPTYFMFEQLVGAPEKSHGAPGVAVLDFDDDGDQDLYVTNGPGAANSLYSNQLTETGHLRFTDVGASAGVGAAEQDSTGVCFGDIDNDGDEDLYVLGRIEANRLFVNNGDGSFAEIANAGGAAGGTLGHTSCSFGDINNDGLLDLFVANSFDWTHREAIFVDPFGHSSPNQVFLNAGDNQFTDVSDSSGARATGTFGPGIENPPTITWAGAIVDIDFDGDADILHADDQGAFLRAKYGGIDRGFDQLLANDGTGHFTNKTRDVNLDIANENMGLSFGDFDCNGKLDFFATNVGDWFFSTTPFPTTVGDNASRWYLQGQNGEFIDPGVGDLVGTPWGWGTTSLDYDNDGDTDIAFYGALSDGDFSTADNPGVLLENQGCSARFTYNDETIERNHQNRVVQGVARGDLNNDGFADMISVAAEISTEPLDYYPTFNGGPFELTAQLFPTMSQTMENSPGGFQLVWNGYDHPDGDLSVEINSGNDNHWVRVTTRGSVGTLEGGRVNRDGIGAVVFVTPTRGNTQILPIVGGSSYSSQNSLTRTFGLGHRRWATVEVLWPGGVRNRLYNVRKSSDVLFPEIPCSYTADWDSRGAYEACVEQAVNGLVSAHVLSDGSASKFEHSALRAYDDLHSDDAEATELRELAASHGVTPIPPAPHVRKELVELGRALMFDKVLSGNLNISCMTCHPAQLGTDDDRHLSRGEGGFGVGKDRFGGPLHVRNAQPLFNLHEMSNHSVFWSSRIRLLPDGTFDSEAEEDITPEMYDTFEFGVVSALGLFPVASPTEMLGEFGTNPVANLGINPDNVLPQIWAALMARLGAIPEYRAMFEAAYPGQSFDDMNFGHATNAMAGFMISEFESRESPWQQFLRGDDTALSYRQMRGAKAFFNNGCVNCHSGPMLSDFDHHDTGLPQIGPSKDDPADQQDFGPREDRGFELVSGDPADRYKFRTAPLNNIGLTAPYGHAGQFARIEDFVNHYDDPVNALLNYNIVEAVDDPLLWAGPFGDPNDILGHLDPLTQVDVVPEIFDFLKALDDPDARTLEHTIPPRVPSGLPIHD